MIFYYTHPIDTEMQKEVMKIERFKNLTWYLDKFKGKFRTRLFKVGNHSVQSQGIMKNVANAWSDADPAQDPSTFKCNLYLVRKRLCCTATGVLRKEHSFWIIRLVQEWTWIELWARIFNQHHSVGSVGRTYYLYFLFVHEVQGKFSLAFYIKIAKKFISYPNVFKGTRIVGSPREKF